VDKTKTTSNNIQNILNSDKNFEDNFYNSPETYVHPTAFVGNNVELASGVKVGPFCTIIGNVKIGENTKIYSGVSIGAPAQHVHVDKPLGTIEIGSNCQIREYVTIGSSAKAENGKTSIGNKCYVMSYSHIAHDVILEDNVVLINSVNLGGHVHVGKNAFLMANCAAHQFCRIGEFVALAPYSAIRQDLPPYCLFSGLPAKFYGLNLVALRRSGLSSANINALKHVTKLFYQDKLILSDIKKLAEQESETGWGKDINVQKFIDFVQNSTRGVSKQTTHIDESTE
jgi:UDP-N-acetylglucosamine acyltransferase